MPKKEKESIFEKPKDTDEDMSESPEQFEDEPSESVDAEEGVYTPEGREALAEDDELADWEEGFASGETVPEKAHCAACGKVLGQDASKLVEKEYDKIKYLFCSTQCANEGIKHAKKK